VRRHNASPCIDNALASSLGSSSSFLWACAVCFKKGVTAVQKAVLKPMAQRAAGAKKPRKKRAKKK